jgi:integrase
MKILLTDRFLRSIKPTGKRYIIWDSAVPGFCAIVTARGKVDFAVIRRMPGERVPLTRRVGEYPIMTLAAAREAALQALRDIGAGIDPKGKQEAERRAEVNRRANTFGAAADDFIARHVAKLRSASEVEASIRRELISRWGEKPLSGIGRRDIVDAHEEISDSRGMYAAHKIWDYTSKFFNWCVARGYIEISPCAGIRASEIIGRKEPRQRVLNDSETRAVWNATEFLGYPSAPFVRMLLISGQRLREVAEMTWPEIDLDKALWVIPPERMKADSAHEVPLSPAATEILKSLPRWTGPYVFTTTGGKRPISGFSKMKLRIDKAMPVPIAPWRFHDLRRSMRTGLSALPIPSNVCELCIAHAQPGLHRVYDQHSYRDEKRRALEMWADRLHMIVEPQEIGNIVRLKAV